MEKFDPNVNYEHKYLKYKAKYQLAKNEIEGGGVGDRYLLICDNDSDTDKKVNDYLVSGKNILKSDFFLMANKNDNTFIYFLEKKSVLKFNATKYIVSQPKEIVKNRNIPSGVKLEVESASGVIFEEIIDKINEAGGKLDPAKVTLYLIDIKLGTNNKFKKVNSGDLVHKA